MGLEAFSYITSLNAANPNGAVDPKSQGDDHIQGIKQTLLNSFPNVDAAVNPTPTEFNRLVGLTSAIVELAGAQTITGNKTFSGGSTHSGATVLNGALSGTSIDNDISLSADSTTRVPTQHAVKTFVEALSPVKASPRDSLFSRNSVIGVTQINNSQLGSAGANWAIMTLFGWQECLTANTGHQRRVRVTLYDDAGSTIRWQGFLCEQLLAHIGNVDRTVFQILLPLDSNSDFWYQVELFNTGSGGGSQWTVSATLDGYIV